MAFSIETLEERYVEYCRKHHVVPNTAMLSGFFQADVKRSPEKSCSLEILLDELKDVDIPPLLELSADINASEIEAVDVRNEKSCQLGGKLALSLMRSVKQKLRLVDLQDVTFGKEFFWDLFEGGLACQVLNLRSYRIRKLNMTGEFMQIHTLNLDYSVSLNGIREGCFVCMPNLKCLSMRETSITNLWTTVAALCKLPSLVDLRFQSLLCRDVAEASPLLFDERSGDRTYFGLLNTNSQFEEAYMGELAVDVSNMEETLENLFPVGMLIDHETQSNSEGSSDDSDVDFSDYPLEYDYGQHVSNGDFERVGLEDPLREGSYGSASRAPTSRQCTDNPSKYTSHHASPICYKEHYREYMIALLPHLEILDELSITRIDRQNATAVFSQYFEYLPYRRKCKESVVSILQKREIKSTILSCTPNGRRSQHYYSRSLTAAKVGSCAWPYLHRLSISGGNDRDECRNFRPRQFEYHPSNPSLMAFGTLDGEVIVVNHESEKLVHYIPSLGDMNSVLGLCWLKKYPYKLVAGSDNGSLRLYDVRSMPSTVTGTNSTAASAAFDDFDQLTSVHVNSTDELFLASGYSRDVALYDIDSGRRLQFFSNMHQAHINVVKFAHHSPSIFATSSFDHDIKMWDLRQKPVGPCYTTSSSKGNVMVCFSPDDHYLLASAVDNEVKQLLAVDGRLHIQFDIESTGSSQNYTRSYYMNGRDYIISGSCDEHVIRVCCAQTGRRLKDISLEKRGCGNSMFVQSLRGDPFRDFNMSILAAYMRPSSKSEIVKVNLLASCEYTKEYSRSHSSHASWGG